MAKKQNNNKKAEKALKKINKKFGIWGTIAFVAIFLLIVLLAAYFSPYFKNENASGKSGSVVVDGVIAQDLKVHFIDVGQGDAILIQTPNKMNVLIDSGDTNKDNTEKLLNYLSKLGVDDIDYLIATHTDSDHIGGFDEVFQEYEVGFVFRPYLYSKHDASEKLADTFNVSAAKECTTKIYSTFLNAIHKEKSQWTYFNKDTDLVINLLDDSDVEYCLKFDFLSPTANLSDIYYNEMNDYSPIIRMSYKDVDFLFTGDATVEVEEEVITAYADYDLDVDVLKVGHHGSTTSTSMEFLNKITPEYAVISCGTGNKYGHPKQAVLNRLISVSCDVYRTDLQGNIVFAVDADGTIASATSIDYKGDGLLVGF